MINFWDFFADKQKIEQNQAEDADKGDNPEFKPQFQFMLIF